MSATEEMLDEVAKAVEKIRSYTFDGLQVLPLMQARDALDDLLEWVERGDYEEERNREAFSATLRAARFALGAHRKSLTASAPMLEESPAQ